MALFTDGLACTSEELRAYESGILDVANSERIELSSKIRVAQQEVGFEILTFMLHNGAEWLSTNRGLDKVVATDSLRHWLAVHCLAATYRDAYYRQLNDRYKEKWAQYSMLTREAKQQYFDGGVGIVANPIPKAATPIWRSAAGGALPARTYFASVAWRRGEGSGEISDPIAVDAGPGELIAIGCNTAPTDVDGWDVYAGRTTDELRRQTRVPLVLGASWTEAAAGIQDDGDVPQGQRAEVWVRLKQHLQRG